MISRFRIERNSTFELFLTFGWNGITSRRTKEFRRKCLTWRKRHLKRLERGTEVTLWERSWSFDWNSIGTEFVLRGRSREEESNINDLAFTFGDVRSNLTFRYVGWDVRTPFVRKETLPPLPCFLK
ncbi:MAG: hypothetical protein ACTS80_01720 [Candidatus Hodgkinia cicadicola]